MQGEQLPLGIQLRDEARFDDFQLGENEELVTQLRALASGEAGQLYLHGESGKSHLLQAACKHAMSQGMSTAYLPLDILGEMGPDVLSGMSAQQLLCVDDIEQVAADKDWAVALMRLCDVARAEERALVLATDVGISDLRVAVPDLATRLTWGGVYALKPLADDDKLHALQLRAKARGLELPAEVGRYLLTRGQRDLTALMETLSQLDTASLAAKRRLTIPFVKTVMER